MVELATKNSIRLECFHFKPDGSSELLWTESFSQNPYGGDNQLWIRLGPESPLAPPHLQGDKVIRFHRDHHFERKIPMADLGELDSYTQGLMATTKRGVIRPRFVWSANFTTVSTPKQGEENSPSWRGGLPTKGSLTRAAKDHALNIIALKASEEK